MYWFFIIFFIAILAYLSENERKFKRSVTLICRISLILLFAFIASYGAPSAQDHHWYALLYERTNLDSFKNMSFYFGKNNGEYEIGYILLNYVGKYFNLSTAAFFFFISLFVNTQVINYIYKYKNAALMVGFFFVSGSLLQQGNIVRQSIAFAFFLFSVRFLVEKKLIKYLTCITAAMFFHQSAMVLFVFAPLCLLKSDKWIPLITVLLWGLWVFSILNVFNIYTLNPAFFAFFSDDYETYLSNRNSISMWYSFSRIVFFNLATFFFFFLFKKRDIIYIVLLVSYTFILNCSVQIPNLSRLNSYFAVVSFVYIFHSMKDNYYLRKEHSIFSIIPIFGVLIYVFYTAIFQLVLSEDVIMLSKTYSFSDFFNN